MAGLQGYQSKQQPQVAQVAPVSTPALTIAAQGLGDLSQRLGDFSSTMSKVVGEEAADKAKNDALKDAANGEPFHKEAVHTIYGKAYNNTLSATYAANANIAITEKSEWLLSQNADNPSGYAAAMQEYTDGLSANAPTPELQTVIGLTGAKTKNAVFGKLTIAEKGRVDAAQVETFNREWELAQNQIIESLANNDTATADTLRNANLQYIETMVREGKIDPAKKQSMINNANFNIRYGTDLKKMEALLTLPSMEQAIAFLSSNTSEQRTDMSYEENTKYNNGLNKLMKSEVTKRKAASKEATEFSTNILNDITSIMKDGGISGYSEEEEDSAFTGSTSKSAKYKYLVQKAILKEQSNWNNMSLSEKEDTLAQYESGERKSANQELIEQLRTSIKDTRTRAKDDVVGLAIKNGVIPGMEYKMSAADGIDGLVTGLDQMKSESYKIKEVYGDTYDNLLTKEDAQSWSDYFEAPGNSNEKLEAIQAISQSHPDVAKTVFRQIGGKNAPSMSFAAALVTDGNSEGARLSLKGKYADVTLEDSANFKTEVQGKLRGVFSHFQDPSTLNQFQNGVINYNRGLVSEGGAELDAEDSVIGSLGSIETYNGKDVILPRGASDSQFEEWLDNYEVEGNVELTQAIQDSTDFFGNKDIQFHYAGQGKYYVHVTNNGRSFYAQGQDEKPLVLDYFKKAE